jgi:hypothetical protein
LNKIRTFRAPLDDIQSEFESIKTEMDEEVAKANGFIKTADEKLKGKELDLDKEKTKIYGNLNRKKKGLLERMSNSNSRRKFDKITFYLSLIAIQYKAYALGRYADNGVFLLNLVLLILLLVWRNFSYRFAKNHYYMFEFCYFANVILYVFIFFFPTSRFLYLGCFAICNGPVGWALALVGCSFVLHDISQLTNCFIHFTPMALMWSVHWKTQYSEDIGWDLYDAKQDTFSWQFVKDYYFSASMIYLMWVIPYYLFVFVILKKRIKERNYTTLVGYHIDRNTFVGKFVTKHGPKYQGILYCVSHFASCMIAVTVSMICFFSFYFNCLVMIVTSSVSFWNGATFYMDYFSKKYEINLKKLDELQTQVTKDLDNCEKKK